MADRAELLMTRAPEISPLGRSVWHDERSRAFAAPTAPVRDVRYSRYCPPYNQAPLNSCVGCAMAGALMTDPYFRSDRVLTVDDAIQLYAAATRLDNFDSQYPPTDRGTSGLAGAKAAKAAGYINGYTHAFGLDHVLGTLSVAPVITGIPWYFSFDEPLPNGECRLTADEELRGGHEVVLFGIDVNMRRIWACNSLGPSWGGLGNGTFWWSWDTYAVLLDRKGDATSFRT